MGLHSDDERELGEEPVVATVSLGAVRQFILKPRKAREGRPQRIELAHGSLLVTGGTCQRHYLHGIPRQATVAGERVSLTFRRLLRTPQGG